MISAYIQDDMGLVSCRKDLPILPRAGEIMRISYEDYMVTQIVYDIGQPWSDSSHFSLTIRVKKAK